MIAHWFADGGARWLLTVAGIILVDIALSGDNALVIGAAASRLAGRQRTFALIWGGLAAGVIRILLTGVATELLLIPLVQSVGAAVILFIAVRMLLPERDDDGSGRRASDRLWTAILSILAADVTMSLDNVLAVGALAHGDLPLLVVGLAISVALLLLASALVARLITRFWWLMDLAALTLAYLAARLVIEDPIVSRLAGLSGARATALAVGVVAVMAALALSLRLRQRRARRREAAATPEEAPAEETAPKADSAAN